MKSTLESIAVSLAKIADELQAANVLRAAEFHRVCNLRKHEQAQISYEWRQAIPPGTVMAHLGISDERTLKKHCKNLKLNPSNICALDLPRLHAETMAARARPNAKREARKMKGKKKN